MDSYDTTCRQNDAMTRSFGNEVLSPFDMCDDARDFLAQLIDLNDAPTAEMAWLVEQSLMAGSQDWYDLIECAKSNQRNSPADAHPLDGSDVLQFVRHISDDRHPDSTEDGRPWGETDRLMAIAQQLAQEELDIRGPAFPTLDRTNDSTTKKPSRGVKYQKPSTSHYWADEPTGPCPSTDNHNSSSLFKTSAPQEATSFAPADISKSNERSDSFDKLLEHQTINIAAEFPNGNALLHSNNSEESPYFANDATPSKNTKRAPLVPLSRLPVPPLDSPRFGIIQETLAHEPFWLLVAVTFLIKTSGEQAIPVFYKVKERFPGPAQVADEDNVEELSNMIRHLGLVVVRLRIIRKFAVGYLQSPPHRDVAYKVRNYDRRYVDAPGDESSPLSETYSWELGHLTQGKYTLDSWRIFCRDELLGRAEDWNGKGREPEFQPEWMRVQPQDKELRAYLRWMWMREGWEWDPITGEKIVLRTELNQAVNEGRVEYDDVGNLRILP